MRPSQIGAIGQVPTPPPPTGAKYGYFADSSGGNSSQFVTAVPEYPLRYVMSFASPTANWTDISNIGAQIGGRWKGSGYKLICPVNVCPDITPSYSNPYFAVVAAGTEDAVFTKIANDLVANGFPDAEIRLAWESNLGWPPWAANASPSGGVQTAYVPMLQRIYNLFKAVSPNFIINSFNPSLGDQGVGNIANFYPGDAYCDKLGPDIYDTSNAPITNPAAQWSSLQTQTYGINYYVSFAATHGKPLSYLEWGLWPSGGSSPYGGGDDPTFITGMLTNIKTNNLTVGYWNDDGSAITPLPSPKPNSLAAMQAGPY